MSLVDDAKDAAEDMKDKVSEKADIVKQRIEGEVDKASGDNIKGEAKVRASEIRDKLN